MNHIRAATYCCWLLLLTTLTIIVTIIVMKHFRAQGDIFKLSLSDQQIKY